jgi:hypothetical protein
MERDAKSIAIAITAHRRKALGHALGIAVLATLADLGASRDGIPGHLGPFNI